MTNFVLILVCLLLGILVKKLERLPASTGASLNGFIIFISLPATVLLQIPRLMQQTQFDWHLLLPISMAWLTFAASFLLFSWLGRRRKWSAARTGALILTAGLGNTSFVGFPLLEALYGMEAVRWGVLIDQLGSFLVLSTLGLWVASSYGQKRSGPAQSSLMQVVTFPPFLALCVALVSVVVGVKMPAMADEILGKLAQTLVPLALFAVGFQLKLSPAIFRRYWKPLTLGLSFKLILVPAVFFVFFGHHNDLMHKVVILEAAMATMITSAVIASNFSLDEELANLMVGVSIPLSLVTVPLWKMLLPI